MESKRAEHAAVLAFRRLLKDGAEGQIPSP